jgi:hypothetical protein
LEANPPTLAERLQRAEKRIAALTIDVGVAKTKQTKQEAALVLANENVTRLKQDLAAAQALVAAHTIEVRQQADASLEAEATQQKPSQNSGEEAKRLKDAAGDLKKQLTTQAKHAAALTKEAEAAKIDDDETAVTLLAAETSLTKWKAALQNAKSSTTPAKTTNLSPARE